jgi:predicted transcriptional regulator
MGGMGGLREEAIQSILNRYNANDTDHYETIMAIEREMFDHLKAQEKKSQEQRRLEQANKPKNLQRARQAPGQARNYKSVPQRPTMNIPKG